MKIIVGLGNPGLKYQYTRHNVGFMTLDRFASEQGDNSGPFDFLEKFNAEIVLFPFEGNKIMLVKPQTFMNRSGDSVLKIIAYYKVDPKKDLIVVYDDVDIALGNIKTSGQSSGGHKGMQSIIDSFKTNNLKRIRIGINSEKKGEKPTENFVLEPFSKNEMKILEKDIFPKTLEKIWEEIKK